VRSAKNIQLTDRKSGQKNRQLKKIQTPTTKITTTATTRSTTTTATKRFRQTWLPLRWETPEWKSIGKKSKKNLSQV